MSQVALGLPFKLLVVLVSGLISFASLLQYVSPYSNVSFTTIVLTEKLQATVFSVHRMRRIHTISVAPRRSSVWDYFTITAEE
jgi:hypothetical protein